MARRSSRVRWLGAAVLLLVGGAVVNVLVAWACARTATLGSRRSASDPPPDAFFDNLFQLRASQRSRINSHETQGLGLTNIDMVAAVFSSDPPTPPSHCVVVIWRAGWPFRAVWCEGTVRTIVSAGTGGVSVMLSGAPGPGRPFPFRPMWPGFAINTALYTAVLASGFVGFRWLRSRRLRGCCQACGYDLRGNVSGVCPECGGKA